MAPPFGKSKTHHPSRTPDLSRRYWGYSALPNAKRSTLVIVNPAAGGGRGGGRWRAVRQIATGILSYEEHWTTAPGEARNVAAEAVASGFAHVLGVGGDGTMHEIANGLAGSEVSLALLPVGTGNDFARYLGVYRPLSQLIRAFPTGHTKAIDLGRVHGQYYLLVAGVGFDASVARLVNALPSKRGGTLPYVVTAIRHAFSFEPPLLRLTIDGATEGEPRRRLMIAVANAPSYGGGMQVCPPARVDDALLHVMSVGAMSGWSTLALLPRVYTGRHLTDPRVHVEAARTVRIDGPMDVPLHADGEAVGGLPACFDVCPAMLRLWLPADCAGGFDQT